MYSFTGLRFIGILTSGVKTDIVCAKDWDNSAPDSESLNGSGTPISANVANRLPGVSGSVKVADRSVSKPQTCHQKNIMPQENSYVVWSCN